MSRKTAPRPARRLSLITHRSSLITLSLVLLCAPLFGACGARRTPDLGRIFAGVRERRGKRPVIVFPGILG